MVTLESVLKIADGLVFAIALYPCHIEPACNVMGHVTTIKYTLRKLRIPNFVSG